MNGLFQGSNFIYNHYLHSQWPGIGSEAVTGLPKGRGDGKFCASPLFPSRTFPKEALLLWGLRSICRWPHSEWDQNPANLSTDVIPKSTWVYEVVASDTPEWREESVGTAAWFVGDTRRILECLLISKNEKGVEFYLNLTYGLIHSCLFGLYLCWSHVTIRP